MKFNFSIIILTIILSSCGNDKPKTDIDKELQKAGVKSSIKDDHQKKDGKSKTKNIDRKSKKENKEIDSIEIHKKVTFDNLNDLKGTIWTFKPFDNCIDTLNFTNASNGYLYSCEHTIDDSITYKSNNDTLIIDKWDFISQVDGAQGKEIKSKYYMRLMNNTLIMLDIKHKLKDEFESVDDKYLGQVYKLINN